MDEQTMASEVFDLVQPYLGTVGTKAAEEFGKKLPALTGKLWGSITAKFKSAPAAEEAVKDLLDQPADADNQGSFRKELRKVLEADPEFAKTLGELLSDARREGGDHISNLGSGSVATHDSVASGQGGIAVGRDVRGGINRNPSASQE